jgi:ectoine hydroxylase-related dioxygenase (phytanoyl-CoA dioxygenase family)
MTATAIAPAAFTRVLTDEERYLFDLQGYLVVPDALDPAQLAELNRLVDRRIEREVPAEQAIRFDWPETMLALGRPFRELIDNPRILPYLHEWIGDSVRLDHDYAEVRRAGASGGGLHGGNTPFCEIFFYLFRGGKPRSGLTVVAYNLHDVGPEDGGFACVPGSHKANYPLPVEWGDLGARRNPCITPVCAPAGSAVIFTEALTHGTLPWRGQHERRTLFYKYSPPSMSWAARFYDDRRFPDLSEQQRRMLEPPNARYGGRENVIRR